MKRTTSSSDKLIDEFQFYRNFYRILGRLSYLDYRKKLMDAGYVFYHLNMEGGYDQTKTQEGSNNSKR